MKIATEPKTLQALLSEAFYTVPRYQRPYSWDVGNLDDFWDDLNSSEIENYFIGPMVFFRGAKKGIEPTCDVVDGQQRLTSTFLLLAAIRDKLAEVGEGALADRVHSFLERLDVNAKAQFVLRVEQEFPFFQSIVAKQEVDTSEIAADDEGKLVRDAYSYFKRRINHLADQIWNNPAVASKGKNKAITARLSEIRDRLLSLIVNAIYLDNEDDAYVVFETLNTRGKDLEIVDLVKNLIMRNMREINSDLDLLKVDWRNFIERLGGPKKRSAHNQLIYHSWLSRAPYVAQKKVFSTIKRSVGPNEVQSYWDGLRADAKVFAKIQNPTRAAWGKQRFQLMRSLQALGVFSVTQPMPAIIALLRCYNEKRITLATLKGAIRAIECFHFKFTAVAGTSSSGGISGMYARLARQVHTAQNGGDMSKALQELSSELRDRIPSAATFSSEFVSLKYGRDIQPSDRLVKYILSELDYHYRRDDAIEYDAWTVEHLTPQSTSSSKKRLDIGNLILVSSDLNGKLGTMAIGDKINKLKAKGHTLDQTLETASRWTDKEIELRSKQLAKLAYDTVWNF